MPTYVYECKECQHSMEVFHSISAEGPKVCENCHKDSLRRKIFAVNSIFKGDGFYSTEYRSDSYKEGLKASETASQPAQPKEEKASSNTSAHTCGSCCNHS